MDNFIDFYDVLQVPFHASEEQIRAAYQKRKGEIHPNFSGARDEYYLVNTAYEILSNPVSRAEYDQIYRGYYDKKYNASHASHTFDQNVHHQAEFQSAPTYSYPPRRRNGWKYTSFISIGLNIVLIIMIANGLYNSLNKNSEIYALEEELIDTYAYMDALEEEYILLENDYFDLLDEVDALINAIDSYDYDNFWYDDYDFNLPTDRYEEGFDDFSYGSDDDFHSDHFLEEEADEEPKEEPKEVEDELPLEVAGIEDDETFTLGSTKDHVKEVMGSPTRLSDDSWDYDFSIVRFENDLVSGWSDISDNLQVELPATNSDHASFTVGSTMQEVINVMGTPTDFSMHTWSYDYSIVRFKDGFVSEWSDISDNLLTE